MGAAAANAGESPESCGGQRPGAGAMGGYELVRSDDAPAAIAVDLEAGGTTAPCDDGNPKHHRGSTPSPPAPASTRQRLVSLDVFRGITVLVRTTNHSHHILPPPLLARSFLLFEYLIEWLAIRFNLNSLPNRIACLLSGVSALLSIDSACYGLGANHTCSWIIMMRAWWCW
jgi:hypothetical protein